MGRLCVALLSVTLVPAAASAQSLTSRELASHCTAADQTDAKAVCLLVVKAFMDGFIEGVGKGVIDVYRYDARVFSDVANVPAKEMGPRIQQVTERATCIQRVSVGELAAMFVKHVRAEPSLAAKNYREALTRTIVANYCQK